MRILKQSTAANVMVLMVDETDHVTGETGLTLTITASKDGAAFASISPTVTERGNGWYNLALTTSHTDTLGDLALHITASGADPTDLACRIVAGSLDADVSTRLAPTTAGRTLDVTATGAAGIDWSNVENPGSTVALAATTISTGQAVASVSGAVGSISGVTFPTNFDLLGINGSGHISRVTLTDTVTTYTGNTPQTGDAFARLGAPAGASVSADIAAVNAKTTNLPSDPADASVIAGRFDTVDAAIAALNDLDSTAVQTAAAAALTAYDPPTNTEMVAAFTEIKGAGFSAGTDTLEEIADAVAAIDVSGTAAAVWDYLLADMDTADSIGERLAGLVVNVNGVMMAVPSDDEGAPLAQAPETILDAVEVETDINGRQALSLMLAALSGKISGGGTTSITIKGADNDTTRIAATVNPETGDRTAVTLTPPA